jgi:hypothetical protein
MPLTIPFHSRVVFNAQRVEDEPIILLDVTDVATLGAGVLRYCSFPAIRLSVDPLLYGVICQGNTYEYALTGHLPSDQEGTPTSAALVIDNADMELTATFVDLTSDNVTEIKLILASAPNEIIRTFSHLRITQVSVNDDGQLSLNIERNVKILGGNTAVEPWPSGRQTINQAPGLHRQ